MKTIEELEELKEIINKKIIARKMILGRSYNKSEEKKIQRANDKHRAVIKALEDLQQNYA